MMVNDKWFIENRKIHHLSLTIYFMVEKKIACYCQNCRAANNLGETICRRCGTRLLLVVFPQSLKYDTNYVPSYYEDHILERVSLLELRLAQITEQLAMALEFISREAKSFQRDHTLLQSFFETLETVNPDLSETLSRHTFELLNEKKEKQTAKNKKEKLLHEIFAAHDAKQTELFAHLIKEGIKLLGEKEEKQAFLNLERAALLSPHNVPLLVFIAEQLFRADKFEAAQKNLEQAFAVEPLNAKILLLLGTIYGDAAETEKARRLLSGLVSDDEKSFCVNYVWGMLAAFEANWTEALAAFKQASENADAPEIRYLIGACYFQAGKFDAALDHFQAAISRDIKYADAWFMQSVIAEFSGDQKSANNARAAALEAKETGAQCLEFLKKSHSPKIEIALPFQHFKPEKNHLLTGGARRLSQFFRERIYQSIE